LPTCKLRGCGLLEPSYPLQTTGYAQRPTRQRSFRPQESAPTSPHPCAWSRDCNCGAGSLPNPLCGNARSLKVPEACQPRCSRRRSCRRRKAFARRNSPREWHRLRGEMGAPQRAKPVRCVIQLARLEPLAAPREQSLVRGYFSRRRNYAKVL